MSRCPLSSSPPPQPLSPVPFPSHFLLPACLAPVSSPTSLVPSDPFTTFISPATPNRAGIRMPRPFGRAVSCPLACRAHQPVPGSMSGCLRSGIGVL